MEKTKKLRLLLPLGTWLMLFAAIALLVTSSVSGASAALTYYSDTYYARVDVSDIGVTLIENGKDVSWRNYKTEGDHNDTDTDWNQNTGALLENMLGEGETLQLGKTYPEVLTVRNSGTIDQYMRVTVSCYWLDADGNKLTTLSPDLIGLHLLGNTGHWIEDPAAATAERHVLYYDSILASGETAEPFSDTLTISKDLAYHVSETRTTDENGNTTIVTTYDYDGVTFTVEAETDAVQTHNAADAIKSAWGANVNITADGHLSLQ